MAGCCTSDLRPPSLNQPNTNVESPNATPPPHEHSGAQSAKPASARAPCGCRGAQRQGGRAQRASSSSWPELFVTRAKFTEFFASRQPARIVMEACGSAHHWGRTFEAMGHSVELLPARQVRAFVWGNKDDAADARAIWMAAQQGDIRRVPVKTTDQQAVQFLHRTRAHWVS